MLKPLLIVTGLISTALGFIGVFIPVLPTTPFLLLAAYCFARSSMRLHEHLVNHRRLGPYISNYYNKAMTPKDKARTLTLMWTGILISATLIGSTITWLILPTIATLVMIHILRLEPRPNRTPTALHEEGVEQAPVLEAPQTGEAFVGNDRRSRS